MPWLVSRPMVFSINFDRIGFATLAAECEDVQLGIVGRSADGREHLYWCGVPAPSFTPLPLSRRPEPFSHPDWLFEVKYDGFRALAYLDPSGVRLVSRNGNRFSSFTTLCASLEFFLKVRSAVLDGEIACLDENGHSQFNELLFRRGTPQFCAFDLLWLNGRDLRDSPLIERKRSLRRLIPAGCDALLYVDHIEGEGERLFELVLPG